MYTRNNNNVKYYLSKRQCKLESIAIGDNVIFIHQDKK